MKLRRFAVVVLLWSGGFATAAAPETGLERVQGYLDDLVDMRAGFEQVLFDARSQPVQRSSGTFMLRRPGRFLWDYTEPYQQRIVADGERLWIYDADLEQVTVRRIEAGLANTPAMLLSGGGDLTDGYEFVRRFDAEETEWVELAPREADTDFTLVRLGFAGNDLSVMDLVDGLGQTTRIRFSAIERNPGLSPELFRFEPPPGTDVIGEEDM